MKVRFKKLKFMYIFYLSAILVLVGTLSIYLFFGRTKEYVEDITKSIYINYVEDVTQNISNMIMSSISGEIYDELNKDKKLKETLEKNLQLLVSDRYRYIYVVDKINKGTDKFRFLLDGSKNKDEKSEFGELYEPLNIDRFKEAYSSKTEVYFTQKDAQGIWMTFIKPLVKNDKTQALLIVDFSLQGHILIGHSLSELDNVLKTGIYVGVIIFFILMLFIYMDNARVKELKAFNEKLELRVRQEVEKNRQKDQQLIQQSRLAQMGEMLSMIAHQWRQPLAAISSASAAIKLKVKLGKLDEETTVSLSDAISKYSKHLSITIDDFRDFFKPNKDKKDMTYDELIRSVLGIIVTSIENKNITLIKDLNSQTIFYTYANELKQVVLNLIKNAEDVLLEKDIENPIIKIKTKDNILFISDNGGGISEELMDKIFDPYFSTKLGKNGTGLGLYMSKTIIEDHCNGKLSVENGEEGAIFKIELSPKET